MLNGIQLQEVNCISIVIICMQLFNKFNYTQKHYKVPDDGIKPKLVARNNKNYIYQTYCCPLTEINIYIYVHTLVQFYNKHNGLSSIQRRRRSGIKLLRQPRRYNHQANAQQCYIIRTLHILLCNVQSFYLAISDVYTVLTIG